jgi:serine/threonine protein kinase
VHERSAALHCIVAFCLGSKWLWLHANNVALIPLLPTLLLLLLLLLPEGEAKGLFRQLLSAVAYLHDHWVLHRDLKVGCCYMSYNTLNQCDVTGK